MVHLWSISLKKSDVSCQLSEFWNLPFVKTNSKMMKMQKKYWNWCWSSNVLMLSGIFNFHSCWIAILHTSTTQESFILVERPKLTMKWCRKKNEFRLSVCPIYVCELGKYCLYTLMTAHDTHNSNNKNDGDDNSFDWSCNCCQTKWRCNLS